MKRLKKLVRRMASRTVPARKTVPTPTPKASKRISATAPTKPAKRRKAKPLTPDQQKNLRKGRNRFGGGGDTHKARIENMPPIPDKVLKAAAKLVKASPSIREPKAAKVKVKQPSRKLVHPGRKLRGR